MQLPDPPAEIQRVPRQFYERLREQLAESHFERLQPQAVSVNFAKELELVIEHPDDPDVSIKAFVSDDWITVFLGDAHEDFSPSDDPGDLEAVGDAVQWLVDALTGRIEFTATYRGEALLSTSYVRRSNAGTQRGGSGFLTPAQLRVWQPKRRVQRRPSWTS